ncbi:DNA methyltransferase [Marinifilum flexuosum]|nr:DNA methyltransferase [Marinifilum flexuosum]
MKEFPDNYFDWAVVDPPYFEGPEKRMYYGSKISNRGIKRVDYPVSDWSKQIPGFDYYEELIRVSRHQIIWGINYFEFAAAVGSGRIIWDKCNGDSSFSDAELASISSIDSTRIFKYMWNGMMQGKSIKEGHIQQGDKRKNEKKIHPTQKPVLLYGWLFDKFIPKGSKILDTHLGSGSSRIAARKLGYDFWAFEIDSIAFQNQENRYQNEFSNSELFIKNQTQ